jgi:hypothetical protein
MSEQIMEMRYEFFSWKGFLVGASVICASLVLQSLLSFPDVWASRSLGYILLILSSCFVVGIASGGILVYLFPPSQDIIGVVGLGTEDSPQYLSLALLVVALIQPIFTGFVFFYEQFANDPFIVIWVMTGFAAPSLGLTSAMFDRTGSIANDLRLYFAHHRKLDMSELDWLHGVGPRTATYRMGMLESAAGTIQDLRIRGHEIIREKDPFPINT